jgi:hypothetical protein
MNETETHETIMTTTTTGTVPAAEVLTPAPAAEEFIQPRGTFASGEERTPEQDAADRQHRGSFASGEETTPEKDADQRVYASGTFAAGEEETPQEDAEERVHPGTFADSEPQEEPTADPTA